MIESENIRLRQIEEADLPKLRDWRNSAIIRPTLRQFTLLNMINQNKWLESLYTNYMPKYAMFVIELKSNSPKGDTHHGLLVGVCGLTYINWKEGHAEISIYIGEKNWQKRGIASEALKRLIKYGFEELRLHRLFAVIFEYNNLSIKLFKRCGFKYEGRHKEARFWDGKYWDEVIMSVLNHEYFENIKNNEKFKN